MGLDAHVDLRRVKRPRRGGGTKRGKMGKSSFSGGFKAGNFGYLSRVKNGGAAEDPPLAPGYTRCGTIIGVSPAFQ